MLKQAKLQNRIVTKDAIIYCPTIDHSLWLVGSRRSPERSQVRYHDITLGRITSAWRRQRHCTPSRCLPDIANHIPDAWALYPRHQRLHGTNRQPGDVVIPHRFLEYRHPGIAHCRTDGLGHQPLHRTGKTALSVNTSSSVRYDAGSPPI